MSDSGTDDGDQQSGRDAGGGFRAGAFGLQALAFLGVTGVIAAIVLLGRDPELLETVRDTVTGEERPERVVEGPAVVGGDRTPPPRSEAVVDAPATPSDPANGATAEFPADPSTAGETTAEAPADPAAEGDAAEAPGDPVAEEDTAAAPADAAGEEDAAEAPGDPAAEEDTAAAPADPAAEGDAAEGDAAEAPGDPVAEEDTAAAPADPAAEEDTAETPGDPVAEEDTAAAPADPAAEGDAAEAPGDPVAGEETAAATADPTAEEALAEGATDPAAEDETAEPPTRPADGETDGEEEVDVAVVTPPVDPPAAQPPPADADSGLDVPPETDADADPVAPPPNANLPPPPPEPVEEGPVVVDPVGPIEEELEDIVEEEDPELPAIPADAELFTPPGALIPGSGRGVVDDTIYAEGLRYPLAESPSYPNSQVWGVGGFRGPRGDGQCDARNYSYPWRDNFCESRSRTATLCPSGRGHQGQDIRPATCAKDTHWAVAVESGQITHLGSYTVTLVGASGREYRYMHLNMRRLAVAKGDRVLRGDRIGLVSNFFGGTPTTIHLHFEIRQVIRDQSGRITKRFVPPYTSLKDAYRRLLISEAAIREAQEGG